MDIADQPKEIGIFIADKRLVAILEKVTGAVVAQVESNGIAGEEPAHECGEGRAGWPKQKMKVVRHQRPRETFHLHLLKERLDALGKISPVVVVGKNVAAFDAANDDVLEQIRNIKSRC